MTNCCGSVDCNTFSPCDSLPTEVLSQIFYLLSYKDLKSARMVCYNWYIASLDPKLTDKEKFVIQCDKDAPQSQMIPVETTNQLRDNKRDVFHLEIKGSSIEWCDENFFSEVGIKLKSLILEPSIGSKDEFFQFLHHCPNLKYLSIRIENIFFSLDSLSNLSQWTFPELLHLERLELNNITLYNLGILQIMLLLTPNLKSIILKRNSLKSLDYRTFAEVIEFLKQNPDRVFDLSLNFLDDCNLSVVLKKQLDDSAITNVQLCALYTQSMLPSLLGMCQAALKELVLSEKVKITEDRLQTICSNCVNLEKLDCSLHGVSSVAPIAVLTKLTSLTLRMMHHLYDNSLLTGFCSDVNTTLKEVNLLDMRQPTSSFIIEFARTHPAVTKLNLKGCAGLNNISIQAIFKYQTSLQVLRIPLCHRITDLGLKGTYIALHALYPGVENPTGHSITRLADLQLLDLHGLQIDFATFKSIKFAQLRDVGLGYTTFPLKTLERFIDNHPNIKNIDVSRLPIDDDFLRLIVKKLPQLENIAIEDCGGQPEEDAYEFLSEKGISRSSDLWIL